MTRAQGIETLATLRQALVSMRSSEIESCLPALTKLAGNREVLGEMAVEIRRTLALAKATASRVEGVSALFALGAAGYDLSGGPAHLASLPAQGGTCG
jgi:hypothetical protein